MAPNRSTMRPNLTKSIGDNTTQVRNLRAIVGSIFQNIAAAINLIVGGAIVVLNSDGGEVARFGYNSDASAVVLETPTIQFGTGSVMSITTTSDGDGPIVDITTF